MTELNKLIVASLCIVFCVFIVCLFHAYMQKNECKIYLQNEAQSLPIYREFIDPTELKKGN